MRLKSEFSLWHKDKKYWRSTTVLQTTHTSILPPSIGQNSWPVWHRDNHRTSDPPLVRPRVAAWFQSQTLELLPFSLLSVQTGVISCVHRRDTSTLVTTAARLYIQLEAVGSQRAPAPAAATTNASLTNTQTQGFFLCFCLNTVNFSHSFSLPGVSLVVYLKYFRAATPHQQGTTFLKKILLSHFCDSQLNGRRVRERKHGNDQCSWHAVFSWAKSRIINQGGQALAHPPPFYFQLLHFILKWLHYGPLVLGSQPSPGLQPLHPHAASTATLLQNLMWFN